MFTGWFLHELCGLYRFASEDIAYYKENFEVCDEGKLNIQNWYIPYEVI